VPVRPARRGRALRSEPVGVDAARHDADLVRGDAHAGQFVGLVPAGGDDAVAAETDLDLAGDPLRRAGVGEPLVPPLHRAEGVVRVQQGQAVLAGRAQCGQARHPVVGVHDVGGPGAPAAGEVAAELVHVRQQRVLGEGLGRPGGHVVHLDAVAQLHSARQVGRVAPGVDGDAVAAVGECAGEAGDVDVLPAGVDSAEGGEGAGVLGDERDREDARVERVAAERSGGQGADGRGHEHTSVIRRSQSARKRLSP
jgi:hypothetical protein